MVKMGAIVWLEALLGKTEAPVTYTSRVPKTCPSGSAPPVSAEVPSRTVPCWCALTSGALAGRNVSASDRRRSQGSDGCR